MKDRLEAKLPREDWFIGATEYNLRQEQAENVHLMFGPYYLDKEMKNLHELIQGGLPDDERTAAEEKIEELQRLRSQFGPSFYMQDEADDEELELSAWAIEQAKNHCVEYVARQLVIDNLAKRNRELSRKPGDIAHLVRRKVWGYLHCGRKLEDDAGELINATANAYDVQEMDEDTIDAVILEAREIFRKFLLTPQD